MSNKVKSAIFIGGFVTFTLAALYPVYVYPKLHPEVFQQIQSDTRKDITQENIQPGNMKVWSDPFKRK
ncbi:hypothetical protein ACROYT_G019540 [Oculina patagonica]